MKEIFVNKEKEMINRGKELAALLAGGDILLLHGELGSGKTSLVKGIAAGLGVKEKITSPTFALMNIYNIPTSRDSSPALGGLGMTKLFVHIDTYRLKNERELVEIGALDYLGEPNVICAIEWPEKIAGLLKNKKTMALTIEHAKNDSRKIKLHSARLSLKE